MLFRSLRRSLPTLCGIAASAAALGSLVWWMEMPIDTGDIILQKPGLDNVPVVMREERRGVIIGEFFEKFDNERVYEIEGRWPNFRGKDHLNIAGDEVPLASSWTGDGPPVLWTIELGEGHAAPIIYDSKVFILDYLEEERADALRCFCLLSGKELWRRWYEVDIRRNHGRSRTVAAASKGTVVTLGPKGHVMSVDAASGKFLWGKDLELEFDATIPLWYTGQCPLIDRDMVVLAPGGPETLLAGVHIRTGEVKWTTPNPRGWKMSHSSVVPVTIEGRKMYVYIALGGVVGVCAEISPGKVLWEIDTWQPTVAAPSPVPLGGGKIFLTAGYGQGSMVARIVPEGDKFFVEESKHYSPREALAMEQQSAVLYGGILYGIMSKDAGIRRLQFTGVDTDDITKFVFPVNSDLRFGLGPFIAADGKFYVLNDDATLNVLEAEAEKINVLSRNRILDGHDAWGPMAFAEGLLILRDSTKMVCLDISKDARWAQKVNTDD